MKDQYDKIVQLTREMIEAGVPEIPAEKKRPRITITLQTLCLTTLIAASGSYLATNWAQENSRPLNRYEKTELRALIFYAARTKGVEEDALRKDVEKQTGVANFDDMTARDFDTARRYLQEKAQ